MESKLTRASQYCAVLEKDKKYDGVFYCAVSTTQVYCRPSCSMPSPLQRDCSFFETAEKAKAQGYQACKICHPERIKNGQTSEILGNIDAGAISSKGVHGLADSLHISERQLRRIVHDSTGVSPLGLNKTKRLNMAKLLITQTELPIIDVAFSADFSSLRQFNDVFKQTFKISPSEMRKTAATPGAS